MFNLPVKSDTTIIIPNVIVLIFNITYPVDSNIPDKLPGDWRAGSHGWWVFLDYLTLFDNIELYPVSQTVDWMDKVSDEQYQVAR
jgi:hypothetical protein